MPRPLQWDTDDAEAALAWLIRNDLRRQIPVEDEWVVKSALRIRQLGKTERLEKTLKLRMRLPPELRERIDQAVRSARARRRQSGALKRASVQAPQRDIQRLREYAKRNHVSIVMAFRRAVEALENQEKEEKEKEK